MKSSANTVKANPLRQQLHYRLKEGALIALGALCIYFWMALLTYSPMDPGVDVSTGVGQVQNAAGRVGAWIASFFLFGLGYSAYLLPLLMVIKVIDLFRSRHQPFHWNGWLFSWRVIGLFFLLLSTAALASIQFQSLGMNPQAPAGGILGQSLGEWGEDALNVQGSTLLFIALFLFGLTVFTDLSWFRVMDLTGKITLDLLELILGAAGRWWSAHQSHRQLKLQLREVDEGREPSPVARRARPVPSAPAAAPGKAAPPAAPLPPAAPPVVAASERIEPVIGLSALDDDPEPELVFPTY